MNIVLSALLIVGLSSTAFARENFIQQRGGEDFPFHCHTDDFTIDGFSLVRSNKSPTGYLAKLYSRVGLQSSINVKVNHFKNANGKEFINIEGHSWSSIPLLRKHLVAQIPIGAPSRAVGNYVLGPAGLSGLFFKNVYDISCAQY